MFFWQEAFDLWLTSNFMLNHISLGVQWVHSCGLCWGQTQLFKKKKKNLRYYCRVKCQLRGSGYFEGKATTSKRKQTRFCRISTKWYYFCILSLCGRGCGIKSLRVELSYLLGGPRRSWLGGGRDQRGSWRGLGGGSLNLLLRNRFKGRPAERWTERKRCDVVVYKKDGGERWEVKRSAARREKQEIIRTCL